MAATGKRRTSLRHVLEEAWQRGFTVKSDFARYNADLVGMAASLGYITTREAAGLYRNVWRITGQGLKHLETLKGFEEEE